jgi:tetratricopeptide (TPR) repeat protein
LLNVMADASEEVRSGILAGQRVAFAHRLASMSKREASQLVRRHGGVVVDPPDTSAHLVVLGEEGLPPVGSGDWERWFEPIRAAGDEGRLEIVSETQLWQRLGLIDAQQGIHRLYTPAMLAELVGVPLAVVRRWHRRGLIVPAREVRKLPYFDFQEVAAARRLAELLALGISPQAIEKKLTALARWLPGVTRPVSQLSVIVEGKQILLRQGEGLIEPGGQLRFDFDPPAAPAADGTPCEPGSAMPAWAGLVPAGGPALAPGDLCRLAAELEEAGRLEEAAEMYRAALSAGGPKPETCFQLAELLYRLGDRCGARERYYMAVELDEDYVEARANLGCVLAELGQRELAAAAFEGALAFHGDYPDAHYHLAHVLDDLGRPSEAEVHWRAFLELSADSPWTEQARERLERESRRGEMPDVETGMSKE